MHRSPRLPRVRSSPSRAHRPPADPLGTPSVPTRGHQCGQMGYRRTSRLSQRRGHQRRGRLKARRRGQRRPTVPPARTARPASLRPRRRCASLRALRTTSSGKVQRSMLRPTCGGFGRHSVTTRCPHATCGPPNGRQGRHHRRRERRPRQSTERRQCFPTPGPPSSRTTHPPPRLPPEPPPRPLRVMPRGLYSHRKRKELRPPRDQHPPWCGGPPWTPRSATASGGPARRPSCTRPRETPACPSL